MNYKETLNLPKTDFPMKANLPSREPEILARWDGERIYEQIQEAHKNDPLFVLHDGPPFANGDVHMGTALNKILKDLIVKSRSMAGFRAPYIVTGCRSSSKSLRNPKAFLHSKCVSDPRFMPVNTSIFNDANFGGWAYSEIGNIPI